MELEKRLISYGGINVDYDPHSHGKIENRENSLIRTMEFTLLSLSDVTVPVRRKEEKKVALVIKSDESP